MIMTKTVTDDDDDEKDAKLNTAYDELLEMNGRWTVLKGIRWEQYDGIWMQEIL